MQAEISDPALAHDGPGVGFLGYSQRFLQSGVEDERRTVATECLCQALALSSHRKASLGTLIPEVEHPSLPSWAAQAAQRGL